MIRTIIVDDGDDGFPQGFWVELDRQGPRFSIRMVIDIFYSDSVRINQYSQILRRPCCLEIAVAVAVAVANIAIAILTHQGRCVLV